MDRLMYIVESQEFPSEGRENSKSFVEYLSILFLSYNSKTGMFKLPTLTALVRIVQTMILCPGSSYNDTSTLL